MSHTLNQKTHNQRNKTDLHKNLREIGGGWHEPSHPINHPRAGFRAS
jgi:hypothetical protein